MTWSWKDELEIYRQAKLKEDIHGGEKSHCKDFEEPGLLEKVSAAVGHRVFVGGRRGESWQGTASWCKSFCALLRNLDFTWQGMEGFGDGNWVSLAAGWLRRGRGDGRGPGHCHSLGRGCDK